MKSEARLLKQVDGTWVPCGPFSNNIKLYAAATVLANLLAKGEAKYRIASMYFEYENLANPEDEVVQPNLGHEDSYGREYYDSLESSDTRDYLRVDIISAVIGSSDATDFPGGDYVEFFAQSGNSSGVFGKEFDNGSNSKIYGAAIVVVLDEDDRSQDIVFARINFPTPQIKDVANQYGVTWRIPFSTFLS